MTTPEATEQPLNPTTSLAGQIDAFQKELMPNVPAEIMQTMMEEMKKLVESGTAEAAIKPGDPFPGFTLPDADQQSKSLSDYLSNGPVVISFYRGAWCPYCNLELNALQQRLAEIEAAGASLVAISPQTPDHSDDQRGKSRLDFDILSDIGQVLGRQCGLVFTLPEALRAIYQAWGVDLPEYNGDDSFELPIPATYILDRNGIIRYAFVNMDYTQRLEPDIIIEQLGTL
jgi:peroxiredoxin